MRTIRLALSSLAVPPRPGEEVSLPRDQARHGALVLRLKEGDPLELTSPLGLASAVVAAVAVKPGGARLSVRLTGPWVGEAAAAGPKLALALIQNQRFDWALEKATELGAARLSPLITERTKGSAAAQAAGRQARWRRLAEEARKQCGRQTPLEVTAPLTLEELMAGPEAGLFLSPGGLAELPAGRADSPLLAVGPEGGFSPAEETALLAAGFLPWRLGPIILRAETAALAALARLSAPRPS
ncbi:MAG: 16S rRNA (uracil(1498)-N(3))-methyltransferase [Candidatus Adiutrix sp.]|jgi:16S rRNA (uracil1498-N3)-methyltransferase|nr:16S rRNA (uracil(1498)-N(3))-methyltransferase [Candidatus Adiutrix sp.]